METCVDTSIPPVYMNTNMGQCGMEKVNICCYILTIGQCERKKEGLFRESWLREHFVNLERMVKVAKPLPLCLLFLAQLITKLKVNICVPQYKFIHDVISDRAGTFFGGFTKQIIYECPSKHKCLKSAKNILACTVTVIAQPPEWLHRYPRCHTNIPKMGKLSYLF